MNCIVYWVAKISKIPIVFSAHGALTVRFRNQFIKSAYNKLITSRILKYASKVIAVNEEEMGQYIKMGVPKKKIEIIPLGINLNDFKPISRSSEFRKKYKISNDEKVILFIGRIHFIKGIEYAIKAVKRLIDDDYQVKFLIVGPDFGYLENLKKLVSKLNLDNQVLFTGHLYGKEKIEAFYNSDIFIAPSISDIFSMVSLEAGYCGLPLVLSEGVLLSKEIKDNAALVVSLDVDNIVKALKRLIDDDSLRLELGEKAKGIIEKKYNSNLIAQKTLNIYESMKKKI